MDPWFHRRRYAFFLTINMIFPVAILDVRRLGGGRPRP
jgi:hypothetical protein